MHGTALHFCTCTSIDVAASLHKHAIHTYTHSSAVVCLLVLCQQATTALTCNLYMSTRHATAPQDFSLLHHSSVNIQKVHWCMPRKTHITVRNRLLWVACTPPSPTIIRRHHALCHTQPPKRTMCAQEEQGSTVFACHSRRCSGPQPTRLNLGTLSLRHVHLSTDSQLNKQHPMYTELNMWQTKH